jgi:hypothetical protein
MDNPWEMVKTTLALVVAPIGGWAFNMERRVAKLEAMKDKVDHTAEQVDRIVEHMIDSK